LLHGLTAAVFAAILLAGGLAEAQEIGAPIVRQAVASTPAATTFRALAKRALIREWKPGDPVRLRSDLKRAALAEIPARDGALDVLLQQPTVLGPSGPQPNISSFDGINAREAGGWSPPDVSGAVGPNHYMQMVNTAIAAYQKDGTKLWGPIPINLLWEGSGGSVPEASCKRKCESANTGDPIVRHDRLADRWLVSQFTYPEANCMCIAISKGPSPSRTEWHLYAFDTVTPDGQSVVPDYPKIGVWPDGYYMGTQRGFPDEGVDVWVFERSKMLAGQPARQVQFSVAAPSLFLMPSDLDGPQPPRDAPNTFIRHVDGALWGGEDRLELFDFSVNWSDPASSTFKLAAKLPTAPFDSVLCGDRFGGFCATQPGSTEKLETLPAWVMWRAQYRNFGEYQSLVTNHTVNADGRGRAGIRWYELRKAGGRWSPHQQGTHSPDGVHRFMGSIAMDQAGNIALGYSASSAAVFPSIRVATRRAADPPGTLAQGEITLLAGAGSQSGGSRWGDYSTMDVDPLLPCTFWYSNMYYDANPAAGDWRTKIVRFQLPRCPAPPAPAARAKRK
jgi:hypothetical protein